MKHLYILFFLLICNASKSDNHEIKALAVLNKKFSNITGEFYFTQNNNGPTIIEGTISGLKPGKYGFHIHENGNLKTSCKDAGGHYNPMNVEHGNLEKGHVGDLGNILITEDSKTKIKIVANRVSLSGSFSVLNRTIMIHGKTDDIGLGSNKGSKIHGNAGPRIGCGIIKKII